MAALTRRPGWALIGSTLLLASCATTPASLLAVKRVDRGQFEITSHVIGSPAGLGGVRARSDRVATEYCAQQGRAMAVVDRRGYDGLASQDILTFRCGAATGKDR